MSWVFRELWVQPVISFTQEMKSIWFSSGDRKYQNLYCESIKGSFPWNHKSLVILHFILQSLWGYRILLKNLRSEKSWFLWVRLLIEVIGNRKKQKDFLEGFLHGFTRTLNQKINLLWMNQLLQSMLLKRCHKKCSSTLTLFRVR